uniref:Inosine/uridine-preferring nucleoside hydrolase domain-containing protein n=1 Tax=Eptatretus burgeri TaxID=7764 RepID=A0A8C4R553_EPTBU
MAQHGENRRKGECDSNSTNEWVQKEGERLFIIDVDCGVDDALALMMLFAAPRARVLAVTCTFGNTSLQQVCSNVLRVLAICKQTEVPVYGGAEASLLGDVISATHFFGLDGLGDVAVVPGQEPPPSQDQLQQEPAALALIRLAKQWPGKINLVAVGPLTNLALAVSLDSSFPSLLRSVYIMGGNMEGRGNDSVSAEFNFFADPEAAFAVLNQYSCPLHIASLEFCSSQVLPWDFFETCFACGSEKATFVQRIMEFCSTVSKSELNMGWAPCDCFAVAAATEPGFIEASEEVAASVELAGHLTRAQMVVDWKGRWPNKRKIRLFTRCDVTLLKKLLTNMMR